MLTDLLDAHHALGRLTERLAAPDDFAFWQADALWREVTGSLSIDGWLVHMHDIALVRLVGGRRDLRDVHWGIDLLAAGERLLGRTERGATAVAHPTPPKPERAPPLGPFDRSGLWDDEDAADPSEDLDALGDEDDDEPPPPFQEHADVADIIAAAKREAALGMGELAGIRAAERAAAPPSRPLPLSADWLALAWPRIDGELDDETVFRIEEAASLIDEALQRPGLSGVAAALHALHRPGFWPEPPPPDIGALLEKESAAEKRAKKSRHQARAELVAGRRLMVAKTLPVLVAEAWTPVRPGHLMARMIAPWLIQRALRLPSPAPWLSNALSRVDRGVMAGICQRPLDAWTGDFCRAVADCCNLERRRLDELDRLTAAWKRSLAHGRARRAGKTVSVLRLLVEHPVIDSGALSRLRGISRRAAQDLFRELRAANILDVEGDGNGIKQVGYATALAGQATAR